LTENVAGALCYLAGLVTGIIFLVIAPYNRNKFVRFHAFQAIFGHIAVIIIWIAYVIIGGILAFLTHGFGFFLYPLFGLLIFVLWLYMMYSAYNNKKVKLPIIGDLAERQACKKRTTWSSQHTFSIGVVKYCCCFLALVVSVAAATESDITPRVSIIEVYGAHKVSIEKIKKAVGAQEGGPLPSREDAEDRIDKLSGVVASRIEAACCDNRGMILYVGVQEKDAPHFEFRPAPSGDVSLPVELVGNYHTFLDTVASSIHTGPADEDLTHGYSLMADSQCRELQQAFMPFVANDLMLLDRVIRESSDPEQRTISAYLLQYAPRGPRTSKVMLDALQYALQDQEDSVRQNAIRSLEAVAVGAKLHPDQQIRVEPTWFVELLNSVVWSDRHNAALALVDLTENRDPDTLALLRQRSLDSVIEMARWHDLKHALPAFILAGRLAGLNEKQIQDAWILGNREPVLEKALHPNKKVKL
jgi:uncharacterized membrane protein